MLIKPIQIEIPTYGTMTYVWTRPYEEKQVCFTTLATAAEEATAVAGNGKVKPL